MVSQFKVFTLPVKYPEAEEEQLNKFLRSHRILNSIPEFVSDGGHSLWSIVVEYMDGEAAVADSARHRTRVDYREKLTPEDFTLFARLREWRKVTAESAGVPVYTIFSNEQLAKIAEGRIESKNGLREIDGIGDSRIEKYGEAIIDLVRSENLM